MLTERLKNIRQKILDRGYCKWRSSDSSFRVKVRGSEIHKLTALFVKRCEEEVPVVFPDEHITFMQTRIGLAVLNGGIADLWRRGKGYVLRVIMEVIWKIDKKRRFCPSRITEDNIHNTCPNYDLILKTGFSGRLKVIEEKLGTAISKSEREFLECAQKSILAFLDLVSRYREEAVRTGNEKIASLLSRVPEFPPEHFHEALQMVRAVSYGQHLAGMTHCGFGRIDQYLWPYYKSDIESNYITRDYAKELASEFFMALNRDTDVYQGVQRGDNGQSVVLGGCVPETGESAVNDLTYLFLEVASEVRMIDPKINLRVCSNTPLYLLELGSRLTACGLGFPQYLNDDVIIPALQAKGYELIDARNYAVAACWEIVIPGKGIEEVNQGAISFPFAVEEALDGIVRQGKFEESIFRDKIKKSLCRQLRNVLKWNTIRIRPSAFLSVLFDDALESGRDVTEIAKYRNIGIHGSAVANAADSLTAILTIYREDGFQGLQELLRARNDNYRRYQDLRARLVAIPKVGVLGASANDEVVFLFDALADVAEYVECNYLDGGTRLRPGSGSAMYYIWLAQKNKRPRGMVEPLTSATSDGRFQGVPFSSSLAPSHDVDVDGVLTVFKVFSRINYRRIVNGGPVTIELSPSVFSDENGIRKLAFLVSYFVKIGGQQLQLNLLDVDQLNDAVKHPELHRNLIVRVWGWSGYFCELAPEFQKQIIARHSYGS